MAEVKILVDKEEIEELDEVLRLTKEMKKADRLKLKGFLAGVSLLTEKKIG